MGWKLTKIKQKTFRDMYILGEKVGSGAFAQVRICKLKSSNERRVAKVINKPYSREDFELEIKLLEEVGYSKCINIVRYYEFFEDQYFFYSVMEYCSGGEILNRISELDKITEYNIADWTNQILNAIKHLHDLGIVHRDIKPQNLLFKDKSMKTIKLIDFGLSYKLTSSLLDEPCGTLEFIAPEIILGKYGRKVDIWACGVMLYLLLFGTFPFNGKDDKELLKNIVESDPKWRYEDCEGECETSEKNVENNRGINSELIKSNAEVPCKLEKNNTVTSLVFYLNSSKYDVPEGAVDLCKILLTKNCKKRPTAYQAMQHPWLLQNRQGPKPTVDQNLISNKIKLNAHKSSLLNSCQNKNGRIMELQKQKIEEETEEKIKSINNIMDKGKLVHQINKREKQNKNKFTKRFSSLLQDILSNPKSYYTYKSCDEIYSYKEEEKLYRTKDETFVLSTVNNLNKASRSRPTRTKTNLFSHNVDNIEEVRESIVANPNEMFEVSYNAGGSNNLTSLISINKNITDNFLLRLKNDQNILEIEKNEKKMPLATDLNLYLKEFSVY